MPLDEQAHHELVQHIARTLARKHRARAKVIQTHISSVIVCGPVAYKLKRPVKLAFVDFSTARLRHRDCLRELRLNQRTAPELYLGVIKITGQPSAPAINGQGRAIDWAVKMKRFRQSDLLSELAQANRLTVPMVDDFARQHADLMQRSPPLSFKRIAQHRDTQAWLLQSLNEITQTQPSLGDEVRAVKEWACKQHEQARAQIAKRQRRGLYRDGHGDLHLANLVRIKHRVVAFDALEFNEALRQIDPVNDIAFTFMDLIAYGRADLAWRLMNRWCEHSADYEGLKLLRYYSLYRAVVRAKVACLSQDWPALARYWGLAQRLSAPAGRTRLILVAGLSGSGKSTVTRALGEHLSAIGLRADVIRKQRFGARLAGSPALYAPAITRQTYAELTHLAQQLLSHDISVMVDATFLDPDHIKPFEALAHQLDVDLSFVWCHAPIAVLERRITARAHRGLDASDATVAVLAQQIQRLQQTPLTYPDHTYRLDTSASWCATERKIQRLAHRITKQPTNR